eukprot:1194181-Prymnesium_polylepis.1
MAAQARGRTAEALTRFGEQCSEQLTKLVAEADDAIDVATAQHSALLEAEAQRRHQMALDTMDEQRLKRASHLAELRAS